MINKIPEELYNEIERDKTFIHIHNPKSAGSMFRTLLKDNFKLDFGNDVPLVSYRKYSKEDMESLLYLYPFSCFSSHNYCLESIPFNKESIISISFVRHPKDKLLSSYSYLKNRRNTSSWHILKKMNLSETLNYLEESKKYHPFLLDASQSDWILGRRCDSLDVFINYLDSETLHLFPTEYFDEVCVVLEKLYPEYFRDCSYANKVNRSKIEEDVKLNSEQIERLPWYSMDLSLHELSKKHLNYLIEKHFGSKSIFHENLDDFRRRCTEKFENQSSNRQNIKVRILSKIKMFYSGK